MYNLALLLHRNLYQKLHQLKEDAINHRGHPSQLLQKFVRLITLAEQDFAKNNIVEIILQNRCEINPKYQHIHVHTPYATHYWVDDLPSFEDRNATEFYHKWNHAVQLWKKKYPHESYLHIGMILKTGQNPHDIQSYTYRLRPISYDDVKRYIIRFKNLAKIVLKHRLSTTTVDNRLKILSHAYRLAQFGFQKKADTLVNQVIHQNKVDLLSPINLVYEKENGFKYIHAGEYVRAVQHNKKATRNFYTIDMNNYHNGNYRAYTPTTNKQFQKAINYMYTVLRNNFWTSKRYSGLTKYEHKTLKKLSHYAKAKDCSKSIPKIMHWAFIHRYLLWDLQHGFLIMDYKNKHSNTSEYLESFMEHFTPTHRILYQIRHGVGGMLSCIPNRFDTPNMNNFTKQLQQHKSCIFDETSYLKKGKLFHSYTFRKPTKHDAQLMVEFIKETFELNIQLSNFYYHLLNLLITNPKANFMKAKRALIKLFHANNYIGASIQCDFYDINKNYLNERKSNSNSQPWHLDKITSPLELKLLIFDLIDSKKLHMKK